MIRHSAARLIERLAHWLALDRSDPAELVSGVAMLLLGIWFVVPAWAHYLQTVGFSLVAQVAPVPVWGWWMITLSLWQWWAVTNKWKHGRILGVWLMLMTRTLQMMLVGDATGWGATFIPGTMAWILLALLAYLRLRL